jgi:hypothetical protein
VPETLPIKDVFHFLAKDCYLVLEVYDDKQTKLFDLPQNRFAALFCNAATPYATIKELSIEQNFSKSAENIESC